MTEISIGFFYLFSINLNSDNGVFSAQVDYSGGTNCVVQQITMYRDRMSLYTIESPKAHTFYISDTGTVFALSDQQLYFYDQQGNVKTLQDLTFPNGFGFSLDNHNFFASDRNTLNVYSRSGELIYELNPCRLFIGFEQGKYIATVSNDTLFFYEDGVEVATRYLSTPYIRRLYISDDKRCVIVEKPNASEAIEFPVGTGQEK
ncbi:MAG: hypothetical protein OEW48_21190 [Phycisphaerae bacterium]|nr:hypothetical protein [Phycisphaerae bacterium]